MSPQVYLESLVPEPWMLEAAARLPGAERDIKDEWKATRFLVGGKMFGMLGEDNRGNRVLTLKGVPANNELLRAQHGGIVPGYYMNKQHWISLLLDRGDLSQALMEELMVESYRLVVAGLPKRVRDALAAATSE